MPSIAYLSFFAYTRNYLRPAKESTLTQHGPGSRHWSPLRTAGLSGALMLPAAALAAPPQYHTVNQTSHAKFDNLQAAVDAANPGNRLKLKGTCVGVINIGKDLTITGQSNPAFGPSSFLPRSSVGFHLVAEGGL